MTCRERLLLERPDYIDNLYDGGCKGCPTDYGYLPYLYPGCDSVHSDDMCTGCWDREIPDNELWTTPKLPYEHHGEPIAKVEKVDISEDGLEAILKPIIKDSGNRRQFESGAVRDMQEGKGRCDLMPLEVIREYLTNPIFGHIEHFKHSHNTDKLHECLMIFADEAYGGCPHTMFLEVAKHFEEGAKKYGENNWQKGIPVNCYIDSAIRHYLKWLRGDKDEPHDRAFVWNLMCCIWETDYHKDALDYEHKFDVDRSTGKATKIMGVKKEENHEAV